jgi:hypothetical protein
MDILIFVICSENCLFSFVVLSFTEKFFWRKVQCDDKVCFEECAKV